MQVDRAFIMPPSYHWRRRTSTLIFALFVRSQSQPSGVIQHLIAVVADRDGPASAYEDVIYLFWFLFSHATIINGRTYAPPSIFYKDFGLCNLLGRLHLRHSIKDFAKNPLDRLSTIP